MRKLSLSIAAVALVAIVWALLSTPGATGGEEGAANSRLAAPAQGVPASSAPTRSAGRPAGDGGQTPSLERLATTADGQVEVKVTAQGRPRAGAAVRLYWRGLMDPNTNDVDWRQAGGGTTGADGVLRLPARSGTFLISVRADGLAPVRRELVRPLGEPLTRIELALAPGVGLRARTVVKKTGEPVPLVEVRLIADARPGSGARPLAPAEEQVLGTSDGQGRLRLEGLAPGHYRVEARSVGYTRWVKEELALPYPGELPIELSGAGVLEGFVVDGAGKPVAGATVMVIGDEEPAVVTSGEGGGFSAEVGGGTYQLAARRGAEAAALPRPVIVPAGTTVRGLRLELKPAGALEGKVVAASTGAPVSGAIVSVSPYLRSGDSGRATSGADGAYAVEGLAPGSYDVVVTAPGFSELSRRGVVVVAGQRFPLELELRGTGAVEGTVLDGAGHPVAGALVREGWRWSGGSLTDAPPQARTDAQGHYRLSGLGVGQVRLVALREEGAAAGATQQVNVREGEPARADFSLADTGTLQGRVTRRSGGPPTRPTEVRAMPLRGSPAWNRGLAPVAPDGSYRMELAAGTYQVGLDFADQDAWSTNFGSQVTANVEAGKVAQLDLASAEDDSSPISGQVVEADGTPSPGAHVTISGMRLNAAVVADAEGSFSVPLEGLAEGVEVRVRARNGGRMGEAMTAAGAGPIRVVLKATGSLRGRILSTDGSPVSGSTLRVTVRGAGGWGGWGGDQREFAGDGYELTDLPGGQLSISVTTREGGRGSAQLPLTEGEDRQLDITIERAATVSGRLVDARTRAPLSEGTVYVDGQSWGESGGTARVAPDGSFQVQDVASGQHLVRIWSAPLRASAERSINLAPGQALDLGDIPLESPRAEPGTIGAQLTRTGGGQVALGWLLPDGPAQRAGLQAGDEVVAVDGTPASDLSDLLQRVRGAPGTTVALTVRRAGAEQTVLVTRAP